MKIKNPSDAPNIVGNFAKHVQKIAKEKRDLLEITVGKEGVGMSSMGLRQAEILNDALEGMDAKPKSKEPFSVASTERLSNVPRSAVRPSDVSHTRLGSAEEHKNCPVCHPEKIVAPSASLDKIYRTTKCFGVNGQGHCKGSFPKGFLEWLKKMGWWGEKRCYLCSGAVDDASAIRVDVRSEVKPTHLEDATKTTIHTSSCNLVIIDPPYSLDLARKLYGTENNFHGIDAFTKEAYRICEVGGLIITLSYAIPKRIKGCNFLSVCGIYTVPFCGYMRCLTVSKKLM